MEAEKKLKGYSNQKLQVQYNFFLPMKWKSQSRDHNQMFFALSQVSLMIPREPFWAKEL
jgi:hypothetical protein